MVGGLVGKRGKGLPWPPKYSEDEKFRAESTLRISDSPEAEGSAPSFQVAVTTRVMWLHLNGPVEVVRSAPH